MLGRYDGVGLLPKHLSVTNQLMMQYPLCTSEHSQAFVQDQTWQLKIIEARTKFTMPPLQKTKRLMLSDLESVKPKCIHDQCNIYKAGKDRSRKPDQWIWLIARPVKAYYKAACHPSPPLPPSFPYVYYKICHDCKIWIFSANFCYTEDHRRLPASEILLRHVRTVSLVNIAR